MKTPESLSDIVSITEASKRLGVSVRTVQRRLDKGDLEPVEQDGKRMVKLPSEPPDLTCQEATSDAPLTRHNATSDTPSASTNVETDHTTEQREEILYLRRQLEESLRGQAELRAAVRELTRTLSQMKALPEPSGQSPESTLETSGKSLPKVSSSQPSRPPQSTPATSQNYEVGAAQSTLSGASGSPPEYSKRDTRRELRPLQKAIRWMLGLPSS